MAAPLSSYQALPHRCELVRTLAGVDYVNDSKATNLDALEKALVSETRPVVLIAGGKDKGFEFDSITALVAEKVRQVILIGEMSARIAKLWERPRALPAGRIRWPRRWKRRAPPPRRARWSCFLPALLPSTCSKTTPIAATNSAASSRRSHEIPVCSQKETQDERRHRGRHGGQRPTAARDGIHGRAEREPGQRRVGRPDSAPRAGGRDLRLSAPSRPTRRPRSRSRRCRSIQPWPPRRIRRGPTGRGRNRGGHSGARASPPSRSTTCAAGIISCGWRRRTA